MIIFRVEWLSFALTLSLIPLLWYFKTLWLLVHLLPNGKEQMLFQSIRGMVNKGYQTIDQYLLCLYAVKFLKNVFLTNFLSFLRTHICLSKHYLCFCPGDSCIYQLLAITHDIFPSFEYNLALEICGMFLDLSKAFDRIWHDGLLFKSKQKGVSENLFQLITSFLSGRFQRVLLNGQTSYWETILVGIPQGSILDHYFF